MAQQRQATIKEVVADALAWVRRYRGVAVVYRETDGTITFADLFDWCDESGGDESNVIARVAYPQNNAMADAKVYYLDR